MKKYLKLLLIGCFVLTLWGCQKSNIPKEREEELKKQANEVIDILNQKDYQALIEMCDEEMKKTNLDSLLPPQWEPFLEDKLGTFKDYGSYYFTSKEGTDTVVVKSKYEKANAQFTISFNQDNQLNGLYFK